MAAVSESEPEVHEDTDIERRTVFEWVFDYYCYIFWEEFKENFTIDSRSERRLFEGRIVKLTFCNVEVAEFNNLTIYTQPLNIITFDSNVQQCPFSRTVLIC